MKVEHEIDMQNQTNNLPNNLYGLINMEVSILLLIY